MLAVDFSQVIFASIFAQSRGNAVTDENLIRHICLNSLRYYKEKFGNDYGRMVLCFDSANPWRHDHFDYYKAKRRADREAASDSDKMDEMFDIMHSIQLDLMEYGPYPCVKVNRCEADDIIAWYARIATEEKFGQPLLIVSGDRDFTQLYHSKYVHQFDPRSKKLLTSSDPKSDLLEKIIRGDSGDGIPNILSDDDTFMNPDKRQSPLRANKLRELIGEFSSNHPTVSTTEQRNFDRNKKLIDFSQIPDDLFKEIDAAQDAQINTKYTDKNRGMKFYQYLIMKDMKILADSIDHFMRGE